MCGLFGITPLDSNDQHKARVALHTLAHRGPDQWDDRVIDSTYLGHRRLSILDLSEAGRQPMLSLDGRIALTANGEIYNHHHLRHELGGKQSFRSNSDSEILLRGYQNWGIEKLLDKIDGMYAFTLFDSNKGKLYLAVDRVGIKPLYYGFVRGQFIWASELKAIEAFFKSSLSIDYTALYDFLTYRYIPGPKSLYQNIFKLEPGHYLELNVDKMTWKEHTYWRVPTASIKIDQVQAVEKLQNLLTKSIQEQMVSDVPLGFFLSGGVDSSCVVATAAAEHSQLHTFSIGFQDERKDESVFAEIVAKQFGTTHRMEILSPDDSIIDLSKMKLWYDEPFGDTSAFPSYQVAKLARNHVTVALTGDGGDELFGGYRWYQRYMRRIGFRRVRHYTPPIISNAIVSCGEKFRSNFGKTISSWFFQDDVENYAFLLGGMLKSDKRIYALDWQIPSDYDDYWLFRKFLRTDLPSWKRLQYLDFHTYLPYDILTKVDRVTMAVSLEARVPLLSRSLVEFSFTLPDEVRLPGGQLKGLLKQAFDGNLPASILNREKQGFSIPHNVFKDNADVGALINVFLNDIK